MTTFVTIPDLPAAATLDGSEQFEIVQANASKRATTSQVKSYVVQNVFVGDVTIPAHSHFTVGQATAAGSIPVAPFAQFGGYGGGSCPDWFGRGVQLDFPAQTYTDTTSSGAKNSVYFNNYGAPNIAFLTPTVVARVATFKINGPTAGANATITHGYCINTSDGDCQFEDNSAFGSVSPTAKVHIGSDIEAASWSSTRALNLLINDNTLSDNSTTAGTTISRRAASYIGTPTFDFILGGSTITDAYALLIGDDPEAGSNATITNTWALGVLGGLHVLGRLATSASTTARAGLNIAPGAAPTSPVDGDIWVTSAGLFVRINGVTVGPLS